MSWGFMFLFNSVLLGVGLAMDAFSVSMADGLNEPGMKKRKMCEIAGIFAIFQALMPMTGWFFVHTASRYFKMFENLIPWIALLLLGFIGGKMLWEGSSSKKEHLAAKSDSKRKTESVSSEEHYKAGFFTLFIQGIATSIDALSVGFTIAGYNLIMALTASAIIAAVTFIICMCGLAIGKKFGTRLSDKAQVLGGSILIVIGIEIFVTGVFKI